MIPRPLYRWKTFWLGVLVLVFLGWAWARSRKHHDFLQLDTQRIKVTFAHEPSCIRVGYLAAESAAWIRGARFESIPSPGTWPDGRFRPGDFGPWFPHWYRSYKIEIPGLARGKEIVLPYWLLIPLFLLPWTAFLLWRVRRLKRLAAGGAEPPARSST